MTTLEVKAELQKSAEATEKYIEAREEADRYRDILTGGRPARYGKFSGTRSGCTNAEEKSRCRLADLVSDADKLLAEMNTAHSRALKLISVVPDCAQRRVLKKRYIYNQKWDDIAVQMNYSLRRIYQLHVYALKKIALYFTNSCDII